MQKDGAGKKKSLGDFTLTAYLLIKLVGENPVRFNGPSVIVQTRAESLPGEE